MPIVMAPTVERNVAYGNAVGASQRAIARMAGATAVGQTLYRLEGTWHLEQVPSHDVLAEADMVLLGGHVYDISEDVYDEIVGDGFAPIVLDD